MERQCAAASDEYSGVSSPPLVSTRSSTPGWAVSFNDGSVLSGQAAGTGMAVRYVQDGNAFAAFDAGPGAAITARRMFPPEIVRPNNWS